MSDLWMPPNMEKLCSAFLRDQPEFEAAADDRCYTAIPDKPTYPLVRVTQLLATPAGSPLWSVAYFMQFEAWGGSKADAWRLATICWALVDARITGTHEGYGVVNGTTPGSMLDLPDEDHDPAKPRFLFTSTIYARPVATLQS